MGWIGFLHVVIMYSIAQVHARLGDHEKCNVALETVKRILDGKRREHWMVGFRSY